jgi:hypothetical protein
MLYFLPPNVSAFVFVAAAVVAAVLYVRAFGGRQYAEPRWWIAWLGVTGAALVLPGMLLAAFATAALMWYLLPKEDEGRITMFVAILPAVPLFEYYIPGPGSIQYLFILHHPRLLILLILVPIFMRWVLAPREGGRRWVSSRVDLLVILYAFWGCVVGFHETSTTDGLRAAFEMITFVVIPYFVVSRGLQSMASLNSVCRAIFFSGVAVAAIGALEQATRWWFYQYVPEQLGAEPVAWFSLVRYERWGFIRIKSSVFGGLSYFMVLATAALIILRGTDGYRRHFLLLLALFGVIIVWTGDRGGMLGFALLIGVFLFFRTVDSPWRLISLAIALVFAFPVVDAIIANYNDEFGTFRYRQELIDAAVPLIGENFWFGFPDMNAVVATGRLEHLRQGEGIIDIVNTYIFEGLFSSGLGLALFVGIFVFALFDLTSLRKRMEHPDLAGYEAIRKGLAAALLSSMFMLATTSPTGHIPNYCWLVFAMSACFCRLARAAAVEAVPAGAPRKPLATPAGAKPVPARFVPAPRPHSGGER